MIWGFRIMRLYASVSNVDLARLVASRQTLAEEFRLLREECDQVIRERRALVSPA